MDVGDATIVKLEIQALRLFSRLAMMNLNLKILLLSEVVIESLLSRSDVICAAHTINDMCNINIIVSINPYS